VYLRKFGTTGYTKTGFKLEKCSQLDGRGIGGRVGVSKDRNNLHGFTNNGRR
jgi:hypothetical protein